VNRPLARSTDGSTVLRSSRFYRLLLVVNSGPLFEELEGAMAKLGFAGHDLAISASDALWPEERPSNWPAEVPPNVAANEQLVRVSGSFEGRPMRVLMDMPIAGGGTFTIWQAWDVGPARALEETATGAAPAPAKPSAPGSSNTGPLVCLVLGALGLGAWRYIATSRRLEKEEDRYDALQVRAERARVGGRIRELMTSGYPEGDAEAIATSESLIRAEEAQALQQEAAQTAEKANS
jgi:hypothetical protein